MRLREYLILNKLSERDFAKKVKVSQAHVNNIIRGRKNASIPLAKKIEDVTKGKVKIADLYNKDLASRHHE